jgi:hypothetical protein
MIGYLMMIVAGFAFGYIVPAWPAFVVPLLIPVLLFIGTALSEGADGGLFVRFLIAVVLTLAAIFAGRLVARARGDEPVRGES